MADRVHTANGTRNLVLEQLPPSDRERLLALAEPVTLEFKQLLYSQEGPVPDLYFPEIGMVSVVTELQDGTVIETGTIGYEGVTGVPAALVGATSPHRVFCQIPGTALRLPVSVLVDEQQRPGSSLLAAVHRYLNYLVAMLSQGAACNRMHTVEARLARWLLMTHDRMRHHDTLALTQEFLSQMLGAQRPTVNIAMATLQRTGFIAHARGRITVVDRAGLESASCDCYAYLRQRLNEMFPGPD